MNRLFVTCSQGLEPLLMQELEEIGLSNLLPGFRGVFVPDTSLETIFSINYRSRLASRVLFPLAQFRCWDRNALYRGISKVDWTAYISPKTTFSIDANVHHRLLRNNLFAAQVAKDAICDQFRTEKGQRPSIDTKNPDVQLNLFIHKDTASISLDTSGAPLHKRGYRQATAEASLRESLAAALLRLANFQSGDILFDPCCGSGILLIEAALMASNTPPGYLRSRWGFMNLPLFSQQTWLKVKAEIDQKRINVPPHTFLGLDIDEQALVSAKKNLRASGMGSYIDLAQGDFRDFNLPITPTLLMTDPPYGKRTGDIDSLRPLYRSLGDFMKKKMPKPSRGYVFTGNLELAKEIGLAAKRRYPLDNGGIDSRLLEFPIY